MRKQRKKPTLSADGLSRAREGLQSKIAREEEKRRVAQLQPLGRPRSMPLLWRPDRHRGAPLLIIYVKDAPFPHPLATLRGTKHKREQTTPGRGAKRSLSNSLLAYPRDTEDQEVPGNG